MVSIRRGWTIPARPEEADRQDRRQRRLLGMELGRWAERARARPVPKEEGPIQLGPPGVDLKKLATSFAEPDAMEAQRVAFGGEVPGAREAAAFGETVRALPEQDRVRLRALARELDRRGMRPGELVELAREQPGVAIGPRVEADIEGLALPPGAKKRVTEIALAKKPEARRQRTFEEIRQAVSEDPEVQAAGGLGLQPAPGGFQEEVLERGVEEPVEALLGEERVREIRGRGAQEELLGDIIADFVSFGGTEVANRLVEGDIEGALQIAAQVGVPVTALTVGSRALRQASNLRRIRQLAQEARARPAARGAPLEAEAVRRPPTIEEPLPGRAVPEGARPVVAEPRAPRPTGLSEEVVDEGRGIFRIRGAEGQLDYRVTPEGAHVMDINAPPGRGQQFLDDLRARHPGTITGDLNTEAGARFFAKQPGARFTEFPSGRDVSADEAIQLARGGRGPRVELLPREVAPPVRPVPEAAAREPTVRQLDLEGREIDTFATERELAGIRETQAPLPLGPARRSPYDNISRDLAEEMSIARTAAPERVAQLEQEQALLRVNEGVDPVAALPGLRAEMDDIAFELSRRGLRFGGRQGLSVRQAAKQRVRGRGVSIQRVPGTPRELQARFDALDSLASRLEAEVPALAAEAPLAAAGGGAPLTAERVAARQATEQTRDLLIANPGREAREAWRLFEGARGESNLNRAGWALDRYDEAKQAGVKIVRRAEIARAGDEQIEMMERIWGAVDADTGRTARGAIGQFPPEQQALVRTIYDRIDDLTTRLIEADPDFAPRALPEYFPHLFKTVKARALRVGAPRGFTTRPGFRRERKLEGMLAEILDNRPDLDLVTWDPIDFVVRHEAAADNYIASLEAIRTLRAQGLIRPQTAGLANWRTPDISPFKLRQKLDGWVAEPKVATMLEQMFGRSAFDQHGVLRTLKATRTALFKMKVIGGLFQQVDYTARALGLGTAELFQARPGQAVRAYFTPIRAIARSISPQVDRAAIKAAEKSPKLRALYRNGLAANVDPSISDQAIRGLGGVVPQTVAGRQIPGAAWTRQALDFIGGDMYRRFHTDMLEQAGLVNLQKHLREGVPLEEAARLSVEETNVFFSSIPAWQSAVKSATGRDLLRFPFFATGELEGWFRLPVQAPAGFAGIMSMTAIAAEMFNILFVGKPLGLEQLRPFDLDPAELKEIRKGPQAIFKTGMPGVDYNTKFLRPELPWRGPGGRKLYLDILGQADTPFRWALDPLFATQTRLGQFPRAALDVAAMAYGERPAFGEPVESVADFGTWALQQISPISVSGLVGTERGRIGLTGAGVQVGGVNVSAQALAERFRDLYVQKHGTEPQPDISPRRLDPELAAQAGFTEETEFGRERAEIVAGEEGQLTDLARIVLRGNPDAMEQFGEELGDFFRFRSGVTETMVRDLNLPEQEASLVREWYDLDPRDRRDPETGQPDWDFFEDQRGRVLSRLRREGASGREAAKALERGTGIQFAEPDLQRAYDAQRELREGLDGYYDEESGEPRERYRRRNPEVDARLFLLGRVSRVVTSAAQREVRSLSRSLLGTEVEAGRGEQRERRFGEPIRIGPVEPIAIGR
jgi:hypothetical protein